MIRDLCSIAIIVCGVISIWYSMRSMRQTKLIEKRWEALNARREKYDNPTR